MPQTAWGTGTGLDRMRELAIETQDATFGPYDHLGMRITAVEKGRVELSWTPTAKVLNRSAAVHGGYIATALDEVCAIAVISMSEPSTPFVTMSLNIDYLRPLLLGQTYTAVGTIQTSGRIRSLARAEISDGIGRLCAQATAALTPNRALLQPRSTTEAEA
ncbi:PaaI family thioesterase [Streptomyces sp. NPDC021080]|uniref:PaaI family thioesterase n=1 Tax=Streptomyces sp. NPDC021080 TaxID=3365110 RepID=UPI0037BC3B1E